MINCVSFSCQPFVTLQKKRFIMFYEEDLEHVFEQKDLRVFLDSGLTPGNISKKIKKVKVVVDLI